MDNLIFEPNYLRPPSTLYQFMTRAAITYGWNFSFYVHDSSNVTSIARKVERPSNKINRSLNSLSVPTGERPQVIMNALINLLMKHWYYVRRFYSNFPLMTGDIKNNSYLLNQTFDEISRIIDDPEKKWLLIIFPALYYRGCQLDSQPVLDVNAVLNKCMAGISNPSHPFGLFIKKLLDYLLQIKLTGNGIYSNSGKDDYEIKLEFRSYCRSNGICPIFVQKISLDYVNPETMSNYGDLAKIPDDLKLIDAVHTDVMFDENWILTTQDAVPLVVLEDDTTYYPRQMYSSLKRISVKEDRMVDYPLQSHLESGLKRMGNKWQKEQAAAINAPFTIFTDLGIGRMIYVQVRSKTDFDRIIRPHLLNSNDYTETLKPYYGKGITQTPRSINFEKTFGSNVENFAKLWTSMCKQLLEDVFGHGLSGLINSMLVQNDGTIIFNGTFSNLDSKLALVIQRNGLECTFTPNNSENLSAVLQFRDAMKMQEKSVTGELYEKLKLLIKFADNWNFLLNHISYAWNLDQRFEFAQLIAALLNNQNPRLESTNSLGLNLTTTHSVIINGIPVMFFGSEEPTFDETMVNGFVENIIKFNEKNHLFKF